MPEAAAAYSRLVSMVLLKNVLAWDGPPLRNTGVPNLFGLSPLRCQFADEKAPNKLGIPTGGSFFNKVLDTVLHGVYPEPVERFRIYSTGAITCCSRNYIDTHFE
jgi:hypothetical protein